MSDSYINIVEMMSKLESDADISKDEKLFLVDELIKMTQSLYKKIFIQGEKKYF